MKKSTIYGYCRISTEQQSIERQERNIKDIYKDAVIVREIFSGATSERKKWNNIKKQVKSGDTIVFDSVSRMSRNSDEGIKEYFELYEKGVELVFLKEPHINSEVYKSSQSNKIELVGDEIDDVLDGINKYLIRLAKKQIKIAFNQAEKEVQDLRQRTREGIITARLNGKQIGRVEGTKIVTKKSIDTKAKILKLSKTFGGNLKDTEILELLNIDRMTYYKYKKELKIEKEQGI